MYHVIMLGLETTLTSSSSSAKRKTLSESCFDFEFLTRIGNIMPIGHKTFFFIISLLSELASERASDSDIDSDTAAAAPAESRTTVSLPEFVSLTLRL